MPVIRRPYLIGSREQKIKELKRYCVDIKSEIQSRKNSRKEAVAGAHNQDVGTPGLNRITTPLVRRPDLSGSREQKLNELKRYQVDLQCFIENRRNARKEAMTDTHNRDDAKPVCNRSTTNMADSNRNIEGSEQD